MTIRPILFSGPMVCALLDGRKTQTRRIIKPRSKYRASLFDGSWTDEYVMEPGNADWRAQDVPFSVGDLLWVKETWGGATRPCPVDGWRDGIEYRADDDGSGDPLPVYSVNWPDDFTVDEIPDGWRPSIYMPRWASRITLSVTEVRVQRLVDIEEEDAEAEGATPVLVPPDGGSDPHRVGFHQLWDSLNAKRGYGWDENPWVAAISFEVIPKNVDEVKT